jgi:hypothetical protein
MRTITNKLASRLGGAFILTTLALAGCGGSGDGGGAQPTPMPLPTPTPTPTPSVSLADLVLLMHFDEPVWDGTARQVLDSSGLGNHGTALAGAASVANGRFGRAGSFGTANAVRIDDTPALHPTTRLTVSAWVGPNGLGRGNWMGIVAKRVDYSVKTAYTLYLSTDNRLSADVDTEDNRFSAPTAITTNGRWYHVALVYDGTRPSAERVLLYVDGNLVAAAAENSTAIQPFDSPLWIGCLPLGQPAQGFDGLIDEVAIWHRSLGTEEIAMLARATAPLTR